MAAHVAADERRGEPILLVPYPLTGPRDIQASERSTRRYRAVAAHAAPPISDDMASLIEAALLAELDQRIVRMRRDDPAAFDRLRPDPGTQRSPAADLLLAGDDILRAADRRNPRIAARNEPLPKLLEPIVAMPYVLMCTAARCGSDALTAMSAFRPRTLGFSGELSASHLAARGWMRHLGLDTLLVPYSGGNTVVGALISGQIDAAFVALPLALTYIGNAKARSLAIASEHRYEHLRDLPTMRESGAPLVVEGWFAVFASARMARQTSDRFAAAIRTYRLGPLTQAQWTARGLIPIAATAEQFEQRIHAERAQARTPLP